MEKAVGIISEFNPFHFGHAYLIRQVKEAFPEKGVVCVMSGNFVQRGSFAVCEKYSRALCALKGGADLVLEIPFPFSCLSAESFASAGVTLLSATGLCDTLAFGTEIAEKAALLSCAENLSSPAFEEALHFFCADNPGVGYPNAREEVYTSLFGEEPILSRPNASLGVLYLVACRKLNAPLSCYPVLRKGEGFHSTVQEGEFLSATALRNRVWAGESLAGSVPESTLAVLEEEKKRGRFPVSEEALAKVLIYLLQIRSRKELSEIYGFSALCDRAKRFAPSCESIEELVTKMKNPSFTDSRIRRSLLALLLNIPRYAEKEGPLYTTVLAANEKGRRLLANRKESTYLPIFTKPAHALRDPDSAVRKQASRAYLADEIYAMTFPKKQSEGYFIKKMPYIERPRD